MKIPVTVTEEAGGRVADLGMQRELEQMLDWARQNVADLRGVRVALGGPLIYRDERPTVILWAHRDWPADKGPLPLVEWEWAGWKAQTFAPQVCTSFTLICTAQPWPAGCGGEAT
jgi:hypothetical protein